MRALRRFLAKCRNSVSRRGQAEDELQREIDAHLGLLEEEFQQRGLSAEEARYAARREYGGLEQAKELHRDERYFLPVEQVWRDLRFAVRGLRKWPGFSLLAILTLALGIGVNTTVFSAYNALALRPLPVADPERVVRLERWFQSRSVGTRQYQFSYPEFLYLRDHNDALAGITAASGLVTVAARIGGAEATAMQCELVSTDYFTVLGVGSLTGRGFAAGDQAVLVLSAQAWQRWFNRDPGVLAQKMVVNGVAFTVLGVAPEGFRGTSGSDLRTPDFWAPLAMQANLATAVAPEFQIAARLRPGVSTGVAQAQISTLLNQYAAYQGAEADPTTRVTLQRPTLLGNTEDVRFQALVAGLLLIVGIVLLIACVNVANMILARGAARQREIGIHLALGASRWRVVRALLAESLVLAAAGGVVGLLLCQWSGRWLMAAIQPLLPFGLAAQVDLSPDYRVFAYGMGLSLLAGVVFGLSPALRFTRTDLSSTMRREGNAFGQRVLFSRRRHVLVAAQVGGSMLLLITAGLLLRGLVRAQATEAGFETRRVYLLGADFGQDPGRARRLIAQFQRVPECRGAAFGSPPLLGTWTPPIVVTPDRQGRTLASYAGADYLKLVGIPVVQGRDLTERDTRAAVISEATARRFWPGEEASVLGRRFKLDLQFRGTWTEFEVVGIAKDVRFANLSRIDPAHVYLPVNANENPGTIVRLDGDLRQGAAALRRVVESTDPALLSSLTLTSVQDGPLLVQRRLAQAYALFAAVLAGLALLLAGIGIYGVMAFLVQQRTPEIGIRMALGARAGEVLRAVIWQGLRAVLAGLGVGVCAAALLSVVLHQTLAFPGAADLLYGVPFLDPVTFLALSGFLVVVAGVASAVPAMRALRVDPMIALRCD